MLLQHAACSAAIVYTAISTIVRTPLLVQACWAAHVMSRQPGFLHHLSSQPVLVLHALACVL